MGKVIHLSEFRKEKQDDEWWECVIDFFEFDEEFMSDDEELALESPKSSKDSLS